MEDEEEQNKKKKKKKTKKKTKKKKNVSWACTCKATGGSTGQPCHLPALVMHFRQRNIKPWPKVTCTDSFVKHVVFRMY